MKRLRLLNYGYGLGKKKIGASLLGTTSRPTFGQEQPTTKATKEAVGSATLVMPDLKAMTADIHRELQDELQHPAECNKLAEMSKYYFDGQGKAIRPVIAMTMGHAYNIHCGLQDDSAEANKVLAKQKMVSIVSEMIHTASLVHDDILDKAETRRGKVSVNRHWNAANSTMTGDYILAVGSKLLAEIRNEEVLIVLSQVLSDLVLGEFQQLQNKADMTDRFKLYLAKTFNKTASLIAYSCKANAILASTHLASDQRLANSQAAFDYGRNVGIAFQLVDDLLDFEATTEQLGKPAAADLKLGLATAPVLFATAKFPELEAMISRRFSMPGDVETTFRAVLDSDGLQQTRALARQHCDAGLAAIVGLTDSKYKAALADITDSVINRLK